MTLKKWQRRWFVLYDDGELTFSVDENPLTIPQVSQALQAMVSIVKVITTGGWCGGFMMADVLNANAANVTNKTQGTYALRARFFVNLSVSPKRYCFRIR